jgi:serine/threonine-protein kinase
LIGRVLSHYRLLQQIGSGGMGIVYRARDQRLERDVAIKLLPAGTLADESARKRFRREALSLSQINHPNIATVHDFDTQDGVDFLVLEHIEGETLDEALTRGPFPEREVAKMGAQLAAGLEAAHQRGVVHRDLKPGNLRVTPDGRLKILDFGLARLLRAAPDRDTLGSLTEAETVVGTLPYMAPEQLSGEKADARADLYAAGALLYELATGRRPFVETSAAPLMYAIMNVVPDPPSSINRRVSAGLESVILKTLEKDPDRRYQSACELKVDLERVATPTAATARPGRDRRALRVPVWLISAASLVALLGVLWVLDPGGWRERLLRAGGSAASNSLAVLPLENLTGDTGQEYFADGMTEELSMTLAKISALTVIAPSAAMHFKGSNTPLPEIARTLNVAAVLTGSVMRSADRVRITVHLLHAATGKQLWAERYDRDLRDVFALQSEVALAIAREIQVRLTPGERARLTTQRTVVPAAHEAYLLARYHMNKASQEERLKAVEYFRSAIGIDSTYALAYAGLGEGYYQLSNYWLPPDKAMPLARAAAQKALELDDDLAEAHALLGIVMALYDWKLDLGVAELDRAVELNPSSSPARAYRGYLAFPLGRFDVARADFLKACELDPLSSVFRWFATMPAYYQRDYRRAGEELRALTAFDSTFSDGYALLGETYEMMGDYPLALQTLGHAWALGSHAWVLGAIGRVHAKAGRPDSARAVLARLDALRLGEYTSPYPAATVHAALGEKDQAFARLEQAFRERCEDLILLKIDPRLGPLRDDPRYVGLLKRYGFPP